MAALNDRKAPIILYGGRPVRLPSCMGGRDDVGLTKTGDRTPSARRSSELALERFPSRREARDVASRSHQHRHCDSEQHKSYCESRIGSRSAARIGDRRVPTTNADVKVTAMPPATRLS